LSFNVKIILGVNGSIISNCYIANVNISIFKSLQAMDSVTISNRLKQIKTEESPVSQKFLSYGGSTKNFNVYEVDVSLLKFNHLNGRIASAVAEFGQINGTELKNLSEEQINENITNWIWDKSLSQNKSTLENIKLKGQIEPGVITKDGIIVDGNRRFMLIKKLNQAGDPRKFRTIILDETYTDGADVELNIKRLETSIQLGQDEKVDYDPIEKYLRVKDFVETYINEGKSLTKVEVATMMMLKSANEVDKYYEICKLMDEYLHTFGMNNLYSRLANTEDLFINLHNQIVNLGKQSNKVAREIGESDIFEYKMYGFYSIRWTYNNSEKDKKWDPKSVRALYFSKIDEKSIFGNKKIWEDFKENVNLDDIDDLEVPTIESLVQNDGMNPIDAAQKVDKVWSSQVNSIFKEAFGRSNSKIDDLKKTAEPGLLIKEALLKLENLIDEEFFKVSNGEIKLKSGISSALKLNDTNKEINLDNLNKIRKISEFIKREL